MVQQIDFLAFNLIPPQEMLTKALEKNQKLSATF